MFSVLSGIATTKYNFTLLMLATFSILWQCCWAKLLSSTRNLEHYNPNLRCPGINEDNVWHSCEHGGYIEENYNSNKCGDRYVCYKGLNESCRPGMDKCAEDAICTMCGKCQKCDSAENCSEFELCPNQFGFPIMNHIKRFWQNRLAKINSQ